MTCFFSTLPFLSLCFPPPRSLLTTCTVHPSRTSQLFRFFAPSEYFSFAHYICVILVILAVHGLLHHVTDLVRQTHLHRGQLGPVHLNEDLNHLATVPVSFFTSIVGPLACSLFSPLPNPSTLPQPFLSLHPFLFLPLPFSPSSLCLLSLSCTVCSAGCCGLLRLRGCALNDGILSLHVHFLNFPSHGNLLLCRDGNSPL